MKASDDKILIIEDESVLRRLLVMSLRGEGYNVYEAEDGKEGLKLALKRKPQLILLDIIMPGMNGMEMLRLLRADKWGKSAHVVLLTNLGEADSIEKAKTLGVSDYMVKSDWSLDELTENVGQRLHGSRA
jgi:CheY-like chemotaxis protein